jgi:hypothetical protein
MARFPGAHKLKIVILDACRENPFAAAMRRTVSLKSRRGLAPVDRFAPPGRYAARTASSPWMATANSRSPQKHLAEPHVEIGKMFRLVTAAGPPDQKQ